MACVQNKNPNNGNELGDIYFILQSIGLENHFTHIFKKGINWESFTNMTEEDMKFLGITSKEEQEALVLAISNMKIPYSEFIEAESLDVEEILMDTVIAFRRLRTSMIRQMRNLENYHFVDPMIDSRTRTTTTLKKILNILNQGTDRLEERLQSMLNCLTEDSCGGWKNILPTWKVMQKRCLSVALETVFNEVCSLFRGALFEM